MCSQFPFSKKDMDRPQQKRTDKSKAEDASGGNTYNLAMKEERRKSNRVRTNRLACVLAVVCEEMSDLQRRDQLRLRRQTSGSGGSVVAARPGRLHQQRLLSLRGSNTMPLGRGE